MRTFKAAAAAVVLTAGAAGAPAVAADADGKWFSGAVGVEVQYDRIYDADDGSEGGDLFTTIEPEVSIHFTPELSLRAGAVLEPVRDRQGDENRTFEDHGAYLETLVIAYETERFGVYGGKFTPVFGLYDFTPGLYGDSFAADYELTERLGFGGQVSAEAEGIGSAILHASVFTADTTVFSDSSITRRGRVRRSDGGVGNTDGLDSFAIALDMMPAAVEGLTVRTGFLRQGKGQGDTASQTAFEIGAVYEYKVDEDLTLLPMVDWARSHRASFDQGATDPDLEQDVVTVGLGVEYGPWFGSLTGGLRYTDIPGGDPDDHFVQASLGYAFETGLAIEGAWITQDVDGADASGLGAMVSYVMEF